MLTQQCVCHFVYALFSSLDCLLVAAFVGLALSDILGNMLETQQPHSSRTNFPSSIPCTSNVFLSPSISRVAFVNIFGISHQNIIVKQKLGTCSTFNIRISVVLCFNNECRSCTGQKFFTYISIIQLNVLQAHQFHWRKLNNILGKSV